MRFQKLFILITLIFWGPISSGFCASHEEVSKAILRDFVDHNLVFKKNKTDAYFKSFSQGQTPKATVVMCADSRAHTDAFEADATNQLFVIRNIGNQLSTAQGSIEYGILHLHTPLLIFVGHSDCGAIKAAQSNYSCETKSIQSELDGLDTYHIQDTNKAIVHNIHHQVEGAMLAFQPQIAKNNLTIVGAVYDFSNDFGQGLGALIIVNINGQTDIGKLKDLEILKGIEGVKLLSTTG